MRKGKVLELTPATASLDPPEMLGCRGGGDETDLVLKLVFGPWEPPPIFTGTGPTFP